MTIRLGGARGAGYLYKKLTGESDIPKRFEASVLSGQIRYIYDAVPGTIFVSIAVFAIILVLLRNLIPTPQLTIWFGTVLLVYSFHYLIYRKFNQAQPDDEQMKPWATLMLIGIGCEGIVWGYAGYSFFSWSYPEVSMLLLLATAGSVAASFNTHSAYLPAYLSYSCLTVFPLATRLMLEGGEINTILSLFCIFFVIALVTDAVAAHRHFREAIVSRLRVEELNHEIDEERKFAEQAREEAEEANIAKSRFLASASHDLRQPLYSLRLFVDVLSHRVSDQQLTPVIENINQATVQNLASIRQAEKSAQDLSDVAQQLETLVARYRLN